MKGYFIKLVLISILFFWLSPKCEKQEIDTIHKINNIALSLADHNEDVRIHTIQQLHRFNQDSASNRSISEDILTKLALTAYEDSSEYVRIEAAEAVMRVVQANHDKLTGPGGFYYDWGGSKLPVPTENPFISTKYVALALLRIFDSTNPENRAAAIRWSKEAIL